MNQSSHLNAPAGRGICQLRYRALSGLDFQPGLVVSLKGDEILFWGQAGLEPGSASEVRVDEVKGVAPPVIAYIEVSACEADASGYRISGLIKGIRAG